MTDQQADEFLAKFQIVHQWSDNPATKDGSDIAPRPTTEGRTDRPQLNDEILANTGLSATLIQKRDANGALTNDYTLSIRSTEFRDWAQGGDGERDAAPTDFSGIAMNGFALAQLRALEQYYQWLKDNGQLPVGAHLDVTGYSLGGHLATVFTEVHQNDSDIQFGQTVGLNAPGRGIYDTAAGSLKDLIDYYGSVLENPDLAQDLAPIDAGDPTTEAAAALLSAARQAQGQPFDPKFVYDDARYRWAKYAAEKKFGTGNMLLWISNQLNGVPDQGVVDTATMNRITHVFGYETIRNTNATANSGIHGQVVRVGIESQPLVEGWSTSLKKLFGDDFGNGHSLTLLADSLALQRAMHDLDSSFTLESFIPILSDATYRVLSNYGNADYEFDALENILDGLRRMLVDPGAAGTQAKEGGSGFGDITGREGFHANLQVLIDSPAFQSIAGRVTIGLSGAGLADSARNSFSALASLLSLSPVSLTATDTASQAQLDTALQSAWGDTYTQWQADRDLAPEDRGIGRETFSDRWIADRAALLDTLMLANQANEQFITDRTLRDAWAYEDLATDTVLLRQPGPGGGTHHVIFGNSTAEALNGAGLEDRLYGGAGGDTLSGLGGDDHLEGGAGADTLEGGEGTDTLLGGAGDDRLEGGAGGDQLDGGAGADVYVVAAGSGTDTVLSSDAADVLQLDGRVLTGQGSLRSRSASLTVWTDDSVAAAPITYVHDTLRGELAISGAGSTVLVRDFASGDLGIAVPDAPVPVPLPAPVDLIDFAAPDAMPRYGEWSRGGQPAATFANVAAGTFRAEGGTQGDVLIGGSVLGAGEFTFGGIELVGRAGDDRLYAVAEQTEAQALAGTPALPPGASAVEGPVLDGGRGDDFIAGSASDDLAFGGAGDDRIVTGAGSDMVFGDGDLGPRFSTLAERGAAAGAMDGGNATGLDGGAMRWRGLTGVAQAAYSLRIVARAGHVIPDRFNNAGLAPGFGSIDPLDDIDLRVFADDSLAPQALPPEHALYASLVQENPDLEPGSFDLLLQGHTRRTGNGGYAYDPDEPDADLRLLDSFSTARHAGVDVIHTGAGDDVVNAGGGDDIVDAGADQDVVAGYAGDDVLDGGSGDDLLFGDYLADPGGTGQGLVSQTDSLGLVRGRRGLDPSRHGNDRLHGGTGRDRLIGGGGTDLLFGGEGDDRLEGDERGLAAAWSGDDRLDGGAGNDELVGGARDDTLLGGTGDDVLVGDAEAGDAALAADTAAQGRDRLDGGAGNDRLYGGGRDDVLIGGSGDDQILGDDAADQLPGALHGNDQLDGGDGNDTLLGGGGDDRILGGAGDDWLAGEDQDDSAAASTLQGDDQLDGGAGHDTLVGGNGADLLRGGSGDDLLFGGAGDDVLEGGAGIDGLKGGAGDDRYIIRAGDVLPVQLADGVLLAETLDDTQGRNRLVLADGAAVTGLADAGNGDLLLSLGAGRLVVKGGLRGAVVAVEQGQGPAQSTADLARQFLNSAITLSTSAAGQWLIGGRSADSLSAQHAGSRLEGGLGNDQYNFNGSLGGTTVALRSGDGVDRLVGSAVLQKSQTQTPTRADNVIDLGAGIARDSVHLSQRLVNGSLRLALGYGSTGDFAVIEFGGTDAASAYASFDRLDFADGGSMGFMEVAAQGVQIEARPFANGTFLGDVFSGNAGSNTYTGLAGNDTYRFGRGDGADTISAQDRGAADVETVQFRAGVAVADVQWVRGNNDLLARIRGTGDELAVLDAFGSNPIGTFVFADGTRLGQQDLVLATMAEQATAGDDTLWGSPDADSVDALDGHDMVNAGAGNDTVLGGAGDGSLYGGASEGDDRLYGGAGNDTLIGGADGGDRLILAGIDAANVTVRRRGSDLRLALTGLRGDEQFAVTLVGQGRADTVAPVEEVRFEAGSGSGTARNDSLSGFDGVADDLARQSLAGTVALGTKARWPRADRDRPRNAANDRLWECAA